MSYLDLQVNGYAGVDFNGDDLDSDSLHRACVAMEREGTERILAAVITDHVPAMCARLRRLVELREKDDLVRRVIVGLHIEGPFINPQDGYRGAHPADAVVPADEEAMRRLLDAGSGLVRIVTLAPEQDAGARVTQLLSRAGVTVSAGHSNASLDDLHRACDAGLSLFTHLGNGCPHLVQHHDNIIQRVLSLGDRLMCCFIADGVHVPFFALRNYLRCAGIERSVVVSDAMAAAGLGPGKYRLGRWNVDVGEDGAAWAPDRSHLVGSAMNMKRAHQNLIACLGLDEADCRRLLHDNPLRAIAGAGDDLDVSR